ncbi:MAG: hypothetical protein LBC42_02675 [Puniceicoccales bacterium]|jgi:hypothetical protein|nr:hypothetical protein [Puniceicoccales bacterium]
MNERVDKNYGQTTGAAGENGTKDVETRLGNMPQAGREDIERFLQAFAKKRTQGSEGSAERKRAQPKTGEVGSADAVNREDFTPFHVCLPEEETASGQSEIPSGTTTSDVTTFSETDKGEGLAPLRNPFAAPSADGRKPLKSADAQTATKGSSVDRPVGLPSRRPQPGIPTAPIPPRNVPDLPSDKVLPTDIPVKRERGPARPRIPNEEVMEEKDGVIIYEVRFENAATSPHVAQPLSGHRTILHIGNKIIRLARIHAAALDANQKIQLNLKDSLLVGSEVLISREDGKLKVQFFTPNEEMTNLIKEQQTGLQSLLARRSHGEVEIVATCRPQEGEPDNNSTDLSGGGSDQDQGAGGNAENSSDESNAENTPQGGTPSEEEAAA